MRRLRTMPRGLARTTRLLVLAALALPAAAAADVADYQLQKLAFEGDPDPAGGTIAVIVSEVSIGEGRVTFWGHDGDARIWVVDGGVVTRAVADGEVAPGTGGSVYTDVGRSRIAHPDVLAWAGAFSGGIGGFLRNTPGDVAMALPGDALPGGGTVAEVSNVHAAAPGPWVAFGVEADPGGPGTLAAHVAHGPSGLREVYREGSAAPAGVGGVFSPVGTSDEADVTADGSVVFGANVSGGSAASGLFHSSAAGTLTSLLLEGDAVATPGGGTFAGLGYFVAANDAGDVSFNAAVLRAPVAFPREGVFVLESGGAQREIVIRGDAVPGAPPAAPLFGGLSGSSPPEISDAGVVVFTATLEDAGLTASARAVLVDDGADFGVLVKEGDPVPDVPGATFLDFSEARIDAQGRIAINASTTLGSGVFLATLPPAIPALPGWGLVAISAILATAWRGSRPARGAAAR